MDDKKVQHLPICSSVASNTCMGESILSSAVAEAIKVQELNSGTEASFLFFISNIFRFLKG